MYSKSTKDKLPNTLREGFKTQTWLNCDEGADMNAKARTQYKCTETKDNVSVVELVIKWLEVASADQWGQ